MRRDPRGRRSRVEAARRSLEDRQGATPWARRWRSGSCAPGSTQTVRVPVVADDGTRTSSASSLALRYKIPLDINIDTSDISGPSAGPRDDAGDHRRLTPGELTGGKRVAVTGTIDPARSCRRDRRAAAEGGRGPGRARADLHRPGVRATTAACRQDLATAKKRVGKNVELAPVSTLAQALKVLRDAGGAPVPARVLELSCARRDRTRQRSRISSHVAPVARASSVRCRTGRR